jgi:hypothetical protein
MHLRSLRHRISGKRGPPTARVELWQLRSLCSELQAIIPKRLQIAAKTTMAAQVKYTGSIDIMIAVCLYLDELEAAGSVLGEDTLQSSELCESEEWSGLSESERVQEDAVQPVEHDDEDDWSSLSECDESTVDLLTLIQSAEEFIYEFSI